MRTKLLPFLPILLLAVTCLLGVSACTDDAVDGFPPDSRNETPEPTRYGALGNSLTAGLINGGLIRGGQTTAHPTLLAAQAGWDAPSLPLVDDPGIGPPNAQGIPQSALFVTKEGAITSTSLDPANIPSMLLNALLPWPYDNLGVPGATTSDLLNATDAASSQSGSNLFFDLILRNSALPPGSWSCLEAMAARNPNALTVWIGSNDVLGGTLGGNPEVGVNITPPQVFEALFLEIVKRIQEMNASYVAVANVPNVTSIPYVTTVPPGTEIPGVGFVRWRMEEDMDGDEDDVVFLTLPASGLFGDPAVAATYLDPPFGTGENTVPASLTLTAGEVAAVSSTIDAYNDVIAREVQGNGWALVDVHTALEALPADPTNPATFLAPNGVFALLPTEGGPFRNQLAAFSLDGVHPSEIGQGIVANLFIGALNDEYGLNVETINIGEISNQVGWEQFGTGRQTAPSFDNILDQPTLDHQTARPHFDEQGLAALNAMVEAYGRAF